MLFCYIGRTKREKINNYEKVTNFRLYPIAFVSGGKINSILFEVHFCLTKKYVALRFVQTIIIHLSIFSKNRITIKHPDFYVWTKVCSRVMQHCGGEFADGGIVQRDFQNLMESHIADWSADSQAYKIKQPVRNIGLQVKGCFLNIYKFMFESYFSATFSHPSFLIGVRRCLNSSSTPTKVY